MKNIYKSSLSICIPILISLIIFIGCSKENEQTSTVTDDSIEQVNNTYPPKRELLTVKDTINAVLSDAMERLRYWDNSGLYENEFAYLTDETNFDEYLTFGQISYRNPRAVTKLVVDSLFMFAHDSAETFVTITLEDDKGTKVEMSDQRLITYYHKGKWIKPTVSVIKHQVEYDDLIKQAEEALKWENE